MAETTRANGRHRIFMTGFSWRTAKIIWMRFAVKAAVKYPYMSPVRMSN
jgi:hypothetical protein